MIQGTLKSLSIILLGAVALGVMTASQHGELTTWHALGKVASDSALHGIGIAAGWLLLESPASRALRSGIKAQEPPKD